MKKFSPKNILSWLASTVIGLFVGGKAGYQAFLFVVESYKNRDTFAPALIGMGAGLAVFALIGALMSALCLRLFLFGFNKRPFKNP